MSINPLNDISRVYLEQVAESSHLETDMDDRHERNEKAIKDMKKTKGYKDMAAAAKKKMEEAHKPNDGNLANNYPPYDKVTRGDVIAGRLGKDQMGGKKKKVKEGFSNWRQDLAEVIDDVENNKKIKEKKVENKITINPKLGEAVEQLGGTLLEMVEIDEFDFIVESAYNELLEEGYEEDDIEEALEFALTEAKVTFGHDTPTTEKKRESLLGAARKKLSGIKKAAKQAVATGARKVAKGALGVARKMEGGDKKPAVTAARKPSTYRGAGVGTKEKVSSGSYTPPSKKKAEKPSDPWEGSATTPPKAKTKKTAAPKAKAPATTAKKKKKSKLDDLLASVRSESVIGNRARSAVADDRLSSEQEKTSASMDKLRAQTKRHEKSTALARTQARIAAKKSEDTARAMHPKPGVSGYRIEETQIDEKINLKKAEMGDVIRDFYKSKAPQFKGRSKEKRREMAIAAKLTAERGGRRLGEQMDTATPDPSLDKKQQMLDKTKLANLKMLQQKKQQLDRQKLQMQKSGKLPLEAD